MLTGERVLVTGVGLVSALALDARLHFERLVRGDSGVQISTRREFQNYASKLEAPVTGFDRGRLITSRMLRKLLSPSSGYSVAAAGGALADGGFPSCDPALRECGVYVGSIAIDIDPDVFIPAFRESLNPEGDFEASRFATRGMKLVDPLFLVRSLPNAGVCGISVEHQVLGSNVNVTNGVVSGLQAVVAATAAIQRGEIEFALAGGYDSLLRLDCVAEQLILGRLSTRQAEPGSACRPFDLDRDGFAVGEGAAFVLLESERHARKRAAPVYGEILGVAQTADASLLLEPESIDRTAFEQAARQALVHSGCAAEEVEVIFGDGLGTRTDDVREADVIHSLIGDSPVPFTAATSSIGFTGAATGAFSFVHALQALKHQTIPPLKNCFRPDPLCAVHFLNQAEERPYERALVWNSDRGMKNVAVLVGSFHA